jgi:TolB protein
MTPPLPTSNETHSLRPRHRRRSSLGVRLTPGGVVVLLSLNAMVLAFLIWPMVSSRLMEGPLVTGDPTHTGQAVLTEEPTSTNTLSPPSPTISPHPTASASPVSPYPDGLEQIYEFSEQDLIILSLMDGRNTHLFAYQPQTLPLTRITGGPWDNITPSLSPDGTRLAFSSNRNGYWNLYILELNNGKISQLTDSFDYDGAPSWSPDGRWIAFESYSREDGDGLDIFILSTEGEQEPIRLTDNPAANFSPAWSPLGRQIAFISHRTGEPEVWIAELDKVGEERFWNASQNPGAKEKYQTWSPDGKQLAWSAEQNGYHNLFIIDLEDVNGPNRIKPVPGGSGDRPVWSPDGQTLLAELLAPNQQYLAAYLVNGPGLVVPPIPMPGRLAGLSWGRSTYTAALSDTFSQTARITPEPLWLPVLTPDAEIPGGRRKLVRLEDVTAPNPMLNDMVDESFQALREDLARQIGWDFLSTLENAYVPLTTALGPGTGDDWLYTGRGIAFTTLPYNAGWMVIVKEDFAPHTYWRVYLRVRFQDGSAGLPLYDLPWDFNARYTGNTTSYEQGGMLAQALPPGYWLDFTSFAARYGWERLPSLSLWRTSFPAARFNELVQSGGLDWRTAMLELYPSAALVTTTPIVPPTRTPSPTPRWYQTPTPTSTHTPRPTLTPLPTSTPTTTYTSEPTDTATPSPTSTRRPSSTPTQPINLNSAPLAGSDTHEIALTGP